MDGVLAEFPSLAFRTFAINAVGEGTASIDVSFRVLAATEEYVTDPSDALSNVPFYGTLKQALRMDRSLASGQGFDQMAVNVGELALMNVDGAYDYLIDEYSVDGRKIVIRIGAKGRPYSTFRPVFNGTASGWFATEDTLRIRLRDNGYKLEVPAQPNVYSGVGDIEGTEDLKGRRKPLCFGFCSVVTPVLVIPDKLVYQVHDGQVDSITSVYDKGAQITYQQDYSSVATLKAATILPGNWASCNDEGCFRLGGRPVGLVTATVKGDKVGDIFASTTIDIIKRLLARTNALTYPNDFLVNSFDALNEIQSAPVGYHVPSDSTDTIRTVIRSLLAGIGAWGDFRRDGLFHVGRIEPPTGTPVGTYDKVNILDIDRQDPPPALWPPSWRFRVIYQRVHTTQTEFVGSVAQNDVNFFKEPYRIAVSSDASAGAQIKAAYPSAQDPEPREAYFHLLSDAQTEADRLLILYSPKRAVYRISLKMQPFIHEMGEVIQVQYSRYGLDEGRLMRIVGFSENMDTKRIDILAFG